MSGGKQTSVKDLRARLGAGAQPSRAKQSGPKAPPPPQPRPPLKDRADDLAEKAEKMAQIHHQTSLLKREPKHDRLKPHKEKKKGGILLQLLIVMVLAGGGAYLLDPGLASSIDLQPVKDWIDVQMQSFD